MSATLGSRGQAGQRARRRLGLWGLGWVGLAVAAGVWQLVSALAGSAELPGVGPVTRDVWQLLTGPVLGQDLIPSIVRTLAGFAISAVLGVVIGLICGYHRIVREWTSAVFNFLRSLPTPLLIPVAL
ncbi:MAG: ABC transporter permease, partial [Solirubrobacteraceae bacterium]